jgi:hypothetical protein
MVIGFNDSGVTNTFSGYARSSNGGSSWDDRGPLLGQPSAVPKGDPVVVSNRAGDFFMANLTEVNPFPPVDRDIWVWRSLAPDNGMNFTSPKNASPSSSGRADKPEMAVDRTTGPYSGRIYVCWTDFGLGGIRFSYSTTNGASFTQIAQSISDSLENVINCSIAVGAAGQVYVAWYDAGLGRISFKRSLDGGATFPGVDKVINFAAHRPPFVSCCNNNALNGYIRNQPFPVLATDPLVTNNVYVVWDTYVNGSSEVRFARSTDQGNTWSGPVQFQDVTSNDQFQPRIATGIWYPTDPDVTAIRVIWYDRRNDTNNKNIDVYADTSFNAGVNWGSDARWTTTTFQIPDLCPDVDSRTLDCYFGDYNAVASRNPVESTFVVGWGDSRETNQGAQDPDVRAAVGC